MRNTRFMTRGRTIAAAAAAALVLGGVATAAALPTLATSSSITQAQADTGNLDQAPPASESNFDPAALEGIQQRVREGLQAEGVIGIPALDAAVAGSNTSEYAIGYSRPGIGTTVSDPSVITTWEEEVDGSPMIFFVTTEQVLVSNDGVDRGPDWGAGGYVLPDMENTNNIKLGVR